MIVRKDDPLKWRAGRFYMGDPGNGAVVNTDIVPVAQSLHRVTDKYMDKHKLFKIRDNDRMALASPRTRTILKKNQNTSCREQPAQHTSAPGNSARALSHQTSNHSSEQAGRYYSKPQTFTRKTSQQPSPATLRRRANVFRRIMVTQPTYIRFVSHCNFWWLYGGNSFRGFNRYQVNVTPSLK